MCELTKKWGRLDFSFKGKGGADYSITFYDATLKAVYKRAVWDGFIPDPWWKVWGDNHIYVSCLETKDKNGAGYAEYELFDQDTFERIM